MPLAARMNSDTTKCIPPTAGTGTFTVVTGMSAQVWIGNEFAVCETDTYACTGVTPPTANVPCVKGKVIKGSATVEIGGKPAARKGDMTKCEGTSAAGVITSGCPTVIIGDLGAGGGGGGGQSGGGSGTEGGTTAATGDGGEGGGTATETAIESGSIGAGATIPPPKRTGCHVRTLTLQCQHNSSDKPRIPLVVHEASSRRQRVYQVVPSEGKTNARSAKLLVKTIVSQEPKEPEDQINLTLDDECHTCQHHSHPIWFVDGTESAHPGPKEIPLIAKSWVTGKKFPWIPSVRPKVYPIVLRSCQNVVRAQVEAYPCDQFELTFDLLAIWDAFADLSELMLKGMGAKWVRQVFKELDPVRKDLQGKTKAAVKKAKQIRGKEAMEAKDKPGATLKRKLNLDTFNLGIEGSWKGQWKEYQDHRAFYAHSLSLKASASGGWDWRFTLISLIPGMQWYAAVPKRVREKIADIYLFVGLSVNASLTGDVNRKSPDTPMYDDGGLTGVLSPGVNCGGTAVIAGGKIGKVQATGSTQIDVSLRGGVDSIGWYAKGDVKWPGCEIKIEAVVLQNTMFEFSTEKVYKYGKEKKFADFEVPKDRK